MWIMWTIGLRFALGVIAGITFLIWKMKARQPQLHFNVHVTTTIILLCAFGNAHAAQIISR